MAGKPPDGVVSAAKLRDACWEPLRRYFDLNPPNLQLDIPLTSGGSLRSIFTFTAVYSPLICNHRWYCSYATRFGGVAGDRRATTTVTTSSGLWPPPNEEKQGLYTIDEYLFAATNDRNSDHTTDRISAASGPLSRG